MKYSTPLVLALFAAFTIPPSAQADTFGSGANTFTIDFVSIGNTNNASDTTGFGAVPYHYRVGTYEISQDAIDKATASGMANVTAGAWAGNQPAANINWYEAAAFVNWLNTSTGKQAAYDLTFSDGSWSMSLWSSEQAWQLGGENLIRNKDAYYFLPSENEWYKAAYYNPDGSDYFLYPTGSNTSPTAVASGTDADTAVYGMATSAPAIVDSTGGLSAYGTMGQGGNVWEWNETARENAPADHRVYRGGDWDNPETPLQSSFRTSVSADTQTSTIGFRVASVEEGPTPIPEPGTWAAAVLLVGAAGYSRWRRRRVARGLDGGRSAIDRKPSADA
jgi:MYXO-CTERM domain-containing protein